LGPSNRDSVGGYLVTRIIQGCRIVQVIFGGKGVKMRQDFSKSGQKKSEYFYKHGVLGICNGK